MNINPLTSILTTRFNNNKKAITFKSNNVADSFEKSTQPKENTVIKWLEEQDYIRKKLVQTLNTPENKIGKGFNHSGYKIPENNEYIFRTSNVEIPDVEIKNYEIRDTEDKNLTVNIGQEVAEIYLKDEDFKRCPYVHVHRMQTGEPIGVKPSSTIYTENGELRAGELPFADISRKEAYEKSVHNVSQLPVEAFEQLLDNIKMAEKSGYSFDHKNSNNILVDTENQSLNLIDMEKSSIKTDCASILYALTNINYFDTFRGKYDNAPVSDDRINNVIGNTIEIINKFTKAMQNKNLKFDKDNCSIEGQNMLLSAPFSFFCNTFNYSDKLAKLREMNLA